MINACPSDISQAMIGEREKERRKEAGKRDEAERFGEQANESVFLVAPGSPHHPNLILSSPILYFVTDFQQVHILTVMLLLALAVGR